jgi:two-component system, NtrC family, response regulator AtoC
MQAKLLGILQARSFRRVGGTQVISFDCQVIAVTSRNLADMMKRGTFREDLFFRLNVVPVTLPPLRECSEDIIPLAVAALARYASEFRKEIVDIDLETKHVLQHYSYPGNIRELENIIERAVIFCPGRILTKGCLPPELHQSYGPVRLAWSRGNEKQTFQLELSSDGTPLAGVEFALIQQALQSTNYNKTLAAKRLGITRFALIRKLKKFEGQVEPCVMSTRSYSG